MPLTLDIRDVLRSCRLGPVALGHTRREVHDLLGPPDDCSDASHMFSRKASIWLYGPLELHFAFEVRGVPLMDPPRLQVAMSTRGSSDVRSNLA